MSDPHLELDYAPDRRDRAWFIAATAAAVVAVATLVLALAVAL